MGFFGFDATMLWLIPGMIFAAWAQYRLSSAYARYSRVGTIRGLRGGDIARTILDRNGLSDVNIEITPGHLTDHYNPSNRTVYLSEAVANGNSIASVGVAAHEVGHAIQHQQAYTWLNVRMQLVGITNFASMASMWILLAGMFIRPPLGGKIMWGAVILFGIVAAFQMITLPVEYDASHRAKKELGRLQLVAAEEMPHVASMLYAAALTYVAALLSALLQLLRLVMIARSRNRD